jgi:hypothetical protein
MNVMSRFAGRAVLEEPSTSDQRVKLFKELARLGRSDAERKQREAAWRRFRESGGTEPSDGVPNA